MQERALTHTYLKRVHECECDVIVTSVWNNVPLQYSEGEKKNRQKIKRERFLRVKGKEKF